MRSALLVFGVSLIMSGTTSVAAQSAAPESVTKGFAQVADWITQSAESVPADKYAFKPAEGVRTFGQLVGHIVDGYRYYCRLTKGAVEWTDTVEKTVSGKAALLKELAAATAECRQATGRLDPLIENLGHTNLHYGNMVVYLRLLGIVPASSR
jgi:uncharacterized damage-inducible protein DinB